VTARRISYSLFHPLGRPGGKAASQRRMTIPQRLKRIFGLLNIGRLWAELSAMPRRVIL
jgi:hypothetical protein